MKRIRQIIFLGLLGLLANVLSCSDKSPKEVAPPEEIIPPLSQTASPAEVVADAARRLDNKPNYSWATTMKEADGSAGKLGTIEGKAEKGGVTGLSFSVGGLPVTVCMKGEKGAANAMMGWQTFDQIAQMGGTPAAVVRYLRSSKTPAAETTFLAGKVKELTAADGAITGELQDAAVQDLLLFGTRQSEGAAAPKTTEARGAVKFWIKNGALTKFEVKISGKVTAGEKESAINRTTTVEIKDVGTTKLVVPDEAKAKLT